MTISTLQKKALSIASPHPAHTLRFRQMPKRGHVVFDLSNAFLYAMDKNASTNMEFGLNPERTHLYLRFNQTSTGLSLKNKTNKYRLKTIGATILWRSLQKKVPTAKLMQTYLGRKVNSCLFEFPLHHELSNNLCVTTIEDIQWFADEEYQKVNIPYIKFTTNYRNYTMLYLSASCLSLAQRSGSTHIECGYNVNQQHLFFRLNKDGKGLAITNRNGQYKNTTIRADGLFLSLQKRFAEIEMEKEYSLINLDETTLASSFLSTLTCKQIKDEHIIQSLPIEWCQEHDYYYQRTYPMTLHFMARKGTPAARNLYLSKSLMDVAQKTGATHIQFGYDVNGQVGYVRLNSHGKGISLKTDLGLYRYAPAGATDLYKSLVRYLPCMQEDKVFICQELNNGTYAYFLEQKVENEQINVMNEETIIWLTSDEHVQSQRVREGNSPYSIKFYQTYKKVKGPTHVGSYAIYLSRAFYGYIKNHKKTYIRFQVDNKNQRLFLHLNNEAGLGLIDPRSGNYFTAHIGMSHIMRSLQVAMPALKERTKYHLHQLDPYTFVMSVEKQIEEVDMVKSVVVKRKTSVKKTKKLDEPKKTSLNEETKSDEHPPTQTLGDSVKFFFESATSKASACYRLRMTPRLIRKWQKGKWSHAHLEWNYEDKCIQIQFNRESLGISLIDSSTYTRRKDPIAIPLSLWPDVEMITTTVRKGTLVDKGNGCYQIHLSSLVEN